MEWQRLKPVSFVPYFTSAPMWAPQKTTKCKHKSTCILVLCGNFTGCPPGLQRQSCATLKWEGKKMGVQVLTSQLSYNFTFELSIENVLYKCVLWHSYLKWTKQTFWNKFTAMTSLKKKKTLELKYLGPHDPYANLIFQITTVSHVCFQIVIPLIDSGYRT